MPSAPSPYATRGSLVAAILVALLLLPPAGLTAQADRPSAQEVREALETLRRFEHALAAEAPGPVPSAHSLDGRQPAERDRRALISPSLGNSPSPQTVTAPGSFSLNIDADLSLGGFVFKEGDPFIHNDGGATYGNTAVGLNALVSATPGNPDYYYGAYNSGFGSGSLQSTTTGYANTAVGSQALGANDTGSNSTAVGAEALLSNTSASSNTAVGRGALRANVQGSPNTALGYRAMASNVGGGANTAVGSEAMGDADFGDFNTALGERALRMNTGTFNTAVGRYAMRDNTSGSSNTAVGLNAGLNWTTGGNNIALGASVTGYAEEANTIRIGLSQQRTFIAGIEGRTTGNNDAVAVLVDSSGQLGTASSSASFKEDIRDLDNISERLFDLRPVAFRYRQPFADGAKPVQFGLIAEEVAQVFPELVVRDADGSPEAVKYHLLSTLLLNELLQQQKQLTQSDETVAWLRHQVVELQRQLERLVESQVPAPPPRR